MAIMCKKCIAVVFLLLIFICWYIPIPDNPILVFAKQPIKQSKYFYWNVSTPFSLKPDKSSKELTYALNEGLKSYRRNYFPSYEKIIGSHCAHFHGDLQGLLDIRQVGIFIKLNTGHIVQLQSAVQEIDDELLDNITQKTIRFNSFLKKNNIPFLFTVFPFKLHKTDQQFPCHIKDYTNENADKVLRSVRALGIDCYDARDIFLDNPEKHYQLYFIGDHHWKEEYAFEAFKGMIAKMSKDSDMAIDERLLDISNYKISEEPFPWQKQSAYKNLGVHYTDLEETKSKMTFQIPHKSPEISKNNNGLVYFHSDNDFSVDKTIVIIRDSYY
ncbi:MAG: hypothetical protein IKW80_00830, partial [Thermoguttaceae bacterium]|nr:hypothetical protein [Thermoguttaceae bacterium]